MKLMDLVYWLEIPLAGAEMAGVDWGDAMKIPVGWHQYLNVSVVQLKRHRFI